MLLAGSYGTVSLTSDRATAFLLITRTLIKVANCPRQLYHTLDYVSLLHWFTEATICGDSYSEALHFITICPKTGSQSFPVQLVGLHRRLAWCLSNRHLAHWLLFFIVRYSAPSTRYYGCIYASITCRKVLFRNYSYDYAVLSVLTICSRCSVQHSMVVTAILLITTFLGNPTLHLTAKAESHGVAYSRFIEYCVSPSLWAHIVLPAHFPCFRLYL